MGDSELFRSADGESLRSLPRLSPADRQTLERLLWLAPDVAVSTAAAVVRAHQPELPAKLLAAPRERSLAEIAPLARAIVYLGLAMAAPVQGKLLPILTDEHFQRARIEARLRRDRWLQAAATGQTPAAESDDLPDSELRRVLDALIERTSRRVTQDPRWLRAVAYSEAGAFYAALGAAAREQFGATSDVSAVADQLERIVRTRELLTDALGSDGGPPTFAAERQASFLERLRQFGWDERVASQGRTLREIADEAAQRGYRPATSFALTEEWGQAGASDPTNGRRYFIRPRLLPDSGGLARWAQEERLQPLQKMLAGDPLETGLRLRLASAELLLEYVVRTGRPTFLEGQWTRTSNQLGDLQTRFGGVIDRRYAITLFPGARLDPTVGVCPIIEVEIEGS